MQEKKYNQKFGLIKSESNDLTNYDSKFKQKYTPDNGNITTGISSDDAFVKINYKLEMERIEKLENERTKQVMNEINKQDYDSDKSFELELRKTKNEEYFYEKITEVRNNQDISAISTNNQQSDEFKFKSTENTIEKQNNESSEITDVKKILIMEDNSHFTDRDRYEKKKPKFDLDDSPDNKQFYKNNYDELKKNINSNYQTLNDQDNDETNTCIKLFDFSSNKRNNKYESDVRDEKPNEIFLSPMKSYEYEHVFSKDINKNNLKHSKSYDKTSSNNNLSKLKNKNNKLRDFKKNNLTSPQNDIKTKQETIEKSYNININSPNPKLNYIKPKNIKSSKENSKILSKDDINPKDTNLNDEPRPESENSASKYVLSFLSSFKFTKSPTRDDLEYYTTDKSDNDDFIQHKGGLGRGESFSCMNYFWRKSCDNNYDYKLENTVTGGSVSFKKPFGRPGYKRHVNSNTKSIRKGSRGDSPKKMGSNIKNKVESSSPNKVKFELNISPERQKELKNIIKERINSVVNKSTYSTRMKDVKNLDKLGDESKRSNDKKSAVVNEPKSGSKTKNKKIKPPSDKKQNKINANLINNNDSFIDRNKLRSKKDGKKNPDNVTKTNENKNNPQVNNLVNLESRATNFESELDNSMVQDIKGLNVNKINTISAENQELIDEYNSLLEANKKIFNELKGDKEIIEQNNDQLDSTKLIFANNDLYRTSNTFNFNIPKETVSCAIQAYDDNLVEFKHKSGKCAMVYDDGSEFTGEMRNGQYHGHGVLTSAKGSTYIGEWKDGMQHGKGKLIFKDGSCYEGMFRNGMKHGKGKTEWAGKENGTRNDRYKHEYKGFYIRDKKHGHGIEKFSNGDVYEGNYNMGKRHGKGLLTWVSGTYYLGDWVFNKMEGNGVLCWPMSKRKYEGQMRDSMRNGIGTFTWGDGDSYQGSFKDDKRCGFGVLKTVDGLEYCGGWEEDVKHGFGTYKRDQVEIRSTWYWFNKEVGKEQYEKLSSDKNKMDSLKISEIKKNEAVKNIKFDCGVGDDGPRDSKFKMRDENEFN
eukprot:Mrub_00326.p1 GENE.Mrub_00326~~Mrub_00326.p1  ORF type:complete len:1177 (+),score=312.53 Mrub_00326:415-3531(+)